MPANDTVFAGPIPELYERLLVPMIFAPFADDLAERVAALGPRRVLETAAGTGAVTRALAGRLPPEARVLATDLNPAMLEVAARSTDDPRIAWQPADALTLPVKDGSFDVVVCQFGVMFFPDKVRGLREARRVLAPGGTLLFNVWDRIENNDFAAAVSAALAARFPDDPPLFMRRTPHGHADLERLRADVEAAGFTDFAASVVRRVSRGGSAGEVASAYCQGTPLRGEIEARAPGRLDEVTRKVTEALARRFGDGPPTGRASAIVVSARAA